MKFIIIESYYTHDRSLLVVPKLLYNNFGTTKQTHINIIILSYSHDYCGSLFARILCNYTRILRCTICHYYIFYCCMCYVFIHSLIECILQYVCCVTVTLTVSKHLCLCKLNLI